jgi:hypothetical protein
VSEVTRKRGNEIGERLLLQPDVQQLELVDQIDAIHWWRRKKDGRREGQRAGQGG